MEPRIVAALALIATSGFGALSALAIYLPRRKREKARRRGIKSHGH